MTSANAAVGRRMSVLSVGTKKGGAGKTTLSHNLAAAAAAGGWKVLLIDTDSQCPSMTAFPVELHENATLAELLQPARYPGLRTRDAIVENVVENLDLLTTRHDLLEVARTEVESLGLRGMETLVRILAQVEQDYDLAIIDTPPELGGLQELAVIASDWALAVCRPNAMEVPSTRSFVSQVRDLAGGRQAPDLQLLGWAWSEYDASAEETGYMVDLLAQEEPDLPMFETLIPTSKLSSKSVILGRPAVIEFPKSSFARAYRELAAEVLGHIAAGTTPPTMAARAEARVAEVVS